MRRFRSALTMITGFGAPVIAQVDRAVLEGAITDPSGRAIVGAAVKVIAEDTGLTEEQRTNSDGYYRLPGLSVDTHKVTVNAPAFHHPGH